MPALDLFNDNDGVRAITGEFSKWSHHVTGVTLNDAHCAACHLEGKVDAGKVVVDTTMHMADAQTHLRNADTDADMAVGSGGTELHHHGQLLHELP